VYEGYERGLRLSGLRIPMARLMTGCWLILMLNDFVFVFVSFYASIWFEDLG